MSWDGEEEKEKPIWLVILRNLGAVVQLLIGVVTGFVWFNEMVCNPEDRHSAHLKEGQTYSVVADSCDDVTVIIAVNRVYKEGKSGKADLVINFSQKVSLNEKQQVLTFLICGKRREVALVWEIDDAEKSVHLRVCAGFELLERKERNE